MTADISNILMEQTETYYVALIWRAHLSTLNGSIHFEQHILLLERSYFHYILRLELNFVQTAQNERLWIIMALSVPKAPGVSQMLKDGARVSIMFMYTLKTNSIFVYFIEKIRFKNSNILFSVCNMTHVRIECDNFHQIA